MLEKEWKWHFYQYNILDYLTWLFMSMDFNYLIYVFFLNCCYASYESSLRHISYAGKGMEVALLSIEYTRLLDMVIYVDGF